ncbi:MAG: HAMP domain-containing sensor histidine kinase [Gammaproteobacteria bacterium]|nr:HAMP domain-containing sensor histidine kinase [Gammaproteobacteria bacterium]
MKRISIKMKHLFLISILILVLETILFLTYNFIYLRMGPAEALNTHTWQMDIIVFSTNLCFLLIIWILFLLYYRYSLPQEILNMIIGNEKSPTTDRTVQKLQQDIKNYYEQKTIMITALAHDIKTPLTEAILRLSLLEDQKEADQVSIKLEEINHIINSSLEYAREPERIRRMHVDVISLIESMAEQYNKNSFIVKFYSSVFSFTLDIELQLFKRMISNIIENSRKYASTCEITITQPTKNHLEIVCLDNGPGVPEKYLHLLSIPYFRVDQSRSSETGGTGLGLAIVKKIAEIHHAKVEFSNRPGGGFMVKINLQKRIPEKSLTKKVNP